jgi:hypothetical protein
MGHGHYSFTSQSASGAQAANRLRHYIFFGSGSCNLDGQLRSIPDAGRRQWRRGVPEGDY